MKIEFRRIIVPINSHKVWYALTLDFETVYTFDYQPGHSGDPFFFSGVEILKRCGLGETDSIKGYFIGVEKEGDILKLHVLENKKDVLTVTKNTSFKIHDLIEISCNPNK